MTMQLESEIDVEMPAPRVTERPAHGAPGLPMALLTGLAWLATAALLVWSIVHTAQSDDVGFGHIAFIVASSVLVLLALTSMGGLTIIAPGEARVLQFLGSYTGTVRLPGLHYVNPLSTKKMLSTRIRNHETAVMKVNDADGNPIEIAAVVVWQVEDTARASFEVDNFESFVRIQAETAVRHIATSYPYDAHGADQMSLRDNANEITERLSAEIAVRVESAGVKIIESRLTHLAYAPEIAHAMLRRQQAGAVVAARQRIVEGAVGMVQLALAQLDEQNVVELDEERKAAMVSNLLVVLCGDRDTQPVINTGSLYH